MMIIVMMMMMMMIMMMMIGSLQFRWVYRRPPAQSGSNPGAASPCVDPDHRHYDDDDDDNYGNNSDN